MIELNGEDLRRQTIQERKRALSRLLGRFQRGIVVNEYFEGDGAIIYKHACALGCEGIVSKRLGTSYRAGRSARHQESGCTCVATARGRGLELGGAGGHASIPSIRRRE
jgi:bifunctional non-homologous end joining protein LigD